MRVFCDFDGTAASIDTTDHILTRFADPSWAVIEQDWIDGRISAAECMRGQVGLIRASDAELAAEMSHVQLAPGFVEFVGWCAQRKLELAILSDGVDRLILPVLQRHGLSVVPVVCNRLAGDEAARVLEQPWMRSDCSGGSGVCKCAARGETAEPFIYIGDGRSDFCIGARADILFAKAALADHAAAIGKSFHPFTDFHDVISCLEAELAAGAGLPNKATELRHVRRA